MKFNWGTGIAIFITLFVAFILSFVFTAAYIKTDLYAEDYYQQELDYQSTITAKNNAISVSNELFLSQGTNSIVVHLPDTVKMDEKSGKIQFYRPNDANDDFTIDIVANNNKMILDKSKFAIGKYHVKVFWTTNNVPYLINKELIIE